MDRAWKDRMSKNPEYALKRRYAQDAYMADCWIYCTVSRKWYTPDEFMESNESIEIRKGKDNGKEFLIVDPKLAYLKKLDYLRKVTDDADAFYKKMAGYFDFKRKKTL